METAKKIKTSAQFITDARKKILPPEKMAEALEKIRKGATASLSLPKVIGILDHLGWKVEAMSGWVPLHYKASDGHMVLESAHVFKGEEIEQKSGLPFHDLHKKMVKESVSNLPHNVKVGERIYMDVTPIKDAGSPGARYFQWKEWVGSDGFKLTTPRKAVIELLPSRHYISQGVRKTLEVSIGVPTHELDKGGWKEDASATLGKEVHIPAAERTRENTGTCPVCWGNYKLLNGRLVLHGYRRPGWGHVVGSCDAENYQPAETSIDGFKMWIVKLAGFLKKDEETMSKIRDGLVDKIKDRSGNWISKSERTFQMHLDNLTRMTEDSIRTMKREIENYDKLITLWKPRPLPKQGERERSMGFFLKP